MTIYEILDRIEALEKEAAELRKLLEKPKDEGVWPKVGDYYFVPTSESARRFRWNGSIFDRVALITGHTFRTSEDAQLYLEIAMRAQELIGDWRPDFDGLNYYFYTANEGFIGEESIFVGNSDCRMQGVTFMPKHAADTLLKEYGDRLKIWITGGRG